MTEEEKKAIEFLKAKMTNWRKYMPEDKELHAEDIALNLIQKQDKKIKDLKEHNSNLIKKSGEDIDLLLKQIDSQDTEINKLNNVIDKMAEYMYKELDFAYSKEMVIKHFMKEDK